MTWKPGCTTSERPFARTVRGRRSPAIVEVSTSSTALSASSTAGSGASIPRSSSTHPRSIARVTGPGCHRKGGGDLAAPDDAAGGSDGPARMEAAWFVPATSSLTALGTSFPKRSSAVQSGVSTCTSHARPRATHQARAVAALPEKSGPQTSVGLPVASPTSSSLRHTSHIIPTTSGPKDGRDGQLTWAQGRPHAADGWCGLTHEAYDVLEAAPARRTRPCVLLPPLPPPLPPVGHPHATRAPPLGVVSQGQRRLPKWTVRVLGHRRMVGGWSHGVR